MAVVSSVTTVAAAECAAGTGTAYDATATSNATAASAGVAAGTGTAYDATATSNATAASAEPATGTGTAHTGTPNVAPAAGAAAGTGAASDVVPDISPAAGAAAGTGAAYRPALAGPAVVSPQHLEDQFKAIWADSPSLESGLTALSVNGSTDDAARIQAMLSYLDSTYGAGSTLYVSPGTSAVHSGITLPAGVRIVGVPGKSTWDFSGVGTGTFTAITVSDIGCAPLAGLSIAGPQTNANLSTANSTAGTGLSITGYGLTFPDVTVSGFHTGIDLAHSNTFIITFERVTVTGCMVGVNVDLDRVYVTGSAVSNSGEKIAFYRSTIANCGTGFLASANGLGMFFHQTSIDFTNVYARISNAHISFTQCHLENSYETSPSTLGTDTGTPPARYLFDLDGNPRLTMDSCLFILGAGIYTIVCAHKGPANYGTGFVQFNNCNGAQGALHSSAPSGTVGVGFSGSPVAFTTGTTTVNVASIFVSRWNLVKTNVSAMDGVFGADRNAYVTGLNAVQGTVEVTLSSAAPSPGIWVEVDF